MNRGEGKMTESQPRGKNNRLEGNKNRVLPADPQFWTKCNGVPVRPRSWECVSKKIQLDQLVQNPKAFQSNLTMATIKTKSLFPNGSCGSRIHAIYFVQMVPVGEHIFSNGQGKEPKWEPQHGPETSCDSSLQPSALCWSFNLLRDHEHQVWPPPLLSDGRKLHPKQPMILSHGISEKNSPF